MNTLGFPRLLGLAAVVAAHTLLQASVFALPTGIGTVTLVDGTQTRCEVLFKHPHAPLLILRSEHQRTVQSLQVGLVHAVHVEDRREVLNPRRALTEAEKQDLERNRLWGDEADSGQIGRYARETWEPRPLIVWARPGESGNALSADSWLDEKGQVLSESPWQTERAVDSRGRRQPETGQFDGDVLLPAAEQAYAAIQAGNRDHLGTFTIRHLTVERHGSYQVRYTVRGNLWMKDGSQIGANTQTGGLGSGDWNKHTFARFGNYHEGRQPQWAYAPSISHWVWIDTGEQGSLEVIGLSGGPGDRLSLLKGTLIVSENSYIGNGNRGCFYSQEGTTTILLDGAGVGSPDPLTGGSSGNVMGTYGIAGTLMFGTPDKPLTRDLEFSACYYPKDRISPKASPSQRTSGGSFVLGPTGRMVVHSADPAKARVIFRPRSRELPFSQYVIPRDLWQYHVRGGPAKPELWKDPRLPNGVAAVFRGQTDFNGVVFDGFYEGGILVDPAARAAWKNVSFGSENHAPPEQLFAPLTD